MTKQTPITDADVIVVGGGGAGLAAASEVARLGKEVILLEKNPHTGGSTSWAVGSFTATNTAIQRRAGILGDNADAHFEDLGLHNGIYAPRDNLALRHILVDRSTETLEWLMSLGVVFVGPMPDPPHRVARMHNVVPNSKSFAYHLTRHCRDLGVDIRVGANCERLLQESGRVAGVETTAADGTRMQYRARGGVVLASGDYSAAPDLKRRLAPAVADVDAVNATSTGDGHRMALELGATVINGDIVRGPILRFIPPTRANFIQKLPPMRMVARLIAWSMDVMPQWLLRPFLMSFLTTALGPAPGLFREGSILINKEGRRFTDELASPAADVARQPERITYIVFDQDLAGKFSAWPHFVSTAPGVAYAYLDDYRRNRKDIYHVGATPAELAASMGVPADNLAQTIAAYNAARPATQPALARAPFYALGPVRSYVVFTDGGLQVTERLEVMRADGSIIPGLYAAGSAGQGGLVLEGHGHHLSWAFLSGRIAGRNAALAAGATA